MFNIGFNMMAADAHRPFNTQYKCYSVSMLPGNERGDVERGGKIIMPPSALDQLTRLNIVYPMLFKLTNSKTNRVTHCGVLEFVADEGKCYLPYWMMRNMLLEEGGLIRVESVSLPVATFSKFQPQAVDFLDITNPKAVLENALRNFACLTAGDIIGIHYNDKVYELCALEVKPGNAVSIIECDMNVEFAAPVGYKEEQRERKNSEHDAEKDEDMEIDASDFIDPNKFRAFSCQGNRLDGKMRPSKTEETAPTVSQQDMAKGVPNTEWKFGKLNFIRSVPKPAQNGTGDSTEQDVSENSFQAFSGSGQSLRKQRKR